MRNILLLIFGCSLCFAQNMSLDERRGKIVEIINEELSEIKRLSGQVRGQNPDYLLRMAELNLEKARLWRDKENSEYLSMPATERRKHSKSKFFSRSSSFFAEANRLAASITKKFPRYRNIGDVYYILGFNAKEAGRNKAAQRYFESANKRSKGSSETKIKSQISLAEVYYNKKKYRSAIPLYESALSKRKDKWWTKDSFNLAWSYYRANKPSKAINKMREVYEASSNSKFVDMRAQVERDIGTFYATSGKIEEGIAFYQKLGIDFADKLLRVAVTLKSQGKYTEADKVLDYAVKHEKNDKKLPAIYIEKLALYDQFGKEGQHAKASRSLYALFQKKYLDSNQIKTFRYQLKKQAAKLQKQVVSKTYKRLKKIRDRKASMAIDYFAMLTKVDPKHATEHQFHKAETAYANSDFSKSIIFYNESFDAAKVEKNKKLLANSAEGLLATLGQKRLAQAIKDRYYAPVYEKYLSEWPKGKKSRPIYQKLFKTYLDEKNYAKAKSVLDRYVKIYPKDWKTQEAMIAYMMEVSRKSKDYQAIRTWIADIDAGKYAVSVGYKKKLQELLTTIQIEGVQNSLSKGDKSVAIKGYHKILKDPHSTKKSKINAKYNLAALYYELGAPAEAYKWSVEALKEMPVSDAISFSDSFLTISGYLFTKQEFKASADISTRIVAKLCPRKTRKKSVAFKNSVYLHLAEGDLKKTEDIIKLAKRCKVPNQHIVDAQFELLEEYKGQSKWTEYETLTNELYRLNLAKGRVVRPLALLEKAHEKFNNDSKRRLYGTLKRQAYKKALSLKQDIPLEGLDDIAEEELQKLLGMYEKLKSTKLKFPESAFNNVLKTKLGMLDAMTKVAGSIQKIGSGKGIIGAYKVLVQAYEHSAQEVEEFVPPGKGPDYIKSFKSSMAQVYGPLKQSAASYKREGWKAIEENKILSDYNYLLAPHSVKGMTIKYAYPHKAVSMDRSGKR